MTDQAASLRAWAAKQDRPQTTQDSVASASAASTKRTVMVLDNTPTSGAKATENYTKVFTRWADQGRKWVGSEGQWQFVQVGPDHPELENIAQQSRYWAIWIDSDLDGFRRAYNCLKALAATGQVKQVLALHEPMLSRRGLLSNLQQVAQNYFDLQLLVFSD